MYITVLKQNVLIYFPSGLNAKKYDELMQKQYSVATELSSVVGCALFFYTFSLQRSIRQ